MSIGSSYRALFSGIILSLGLLCWGHTGHTREASVGKVVYLKGEVTVSRLSESSTRPLTFQDTIYQMDILETKEGELTIQLSDRSVLRLSPHSKVMITEYVFRKDSRSRKSVFDIVKGSVRTIVQKFPNMQQNDVRLQTSAAVAGIRGTDVVTVVRDNPKKKGTITQYLLDEGLIEVFSVDYPDTVVQVKPGYYVAVNEGFPPSSPIEMIPSIRQSIFSDAANLSQVLQLLKAPPPEGSGPHNSQGPSAPPTIGDTSSNPGALDRQLNETGSGPTTPPVEVPPGQAPVKVPVTFEERR